MKALVDVTERPVKRSMLMPPLPAPELHLEAGSHTPSPLDDRWQDGMRVRTERFGVRTLGHDEHRGKAVRFDQLIHFWEVLRSLRYELPNRLTCPHQGVQRLRPVAQSLLVT